MVRKILIAILFVTVFTLIFSFLAFKLQIDKSVKSLAEASQENKNVITEEMLKDLPPPVQRYLRYSQVIGKPQVNFVHLKQIGQMKPSPEGKWFSFSADEYYSVNPAGFIWHVRGPKEWPFILQGKDTYIGAKGQMLIKLASLFPVANANGPEIDQGAQLRYLNEMMWFPTAFLGENITWKSIDNNSAEVTLTENNQSVSAVMFFDEEGKLVNFVAKRYMNKNNKFSLETWETPIVSYGEFNGYKLPKVGYAFWKLKTGDYRYIEITIKDIELDPK